MLRYSHVGILQMGVAARRGSLAMRRIAYSTGSGGLKGVSVVAARRTTPVSALGSAPVAVAGSVLGLGQGAGTGQSGVSLRALGRSYATADAALGRDEDASYVGGGDGREKPARPQRYKESLLDIAKEGTSPRQRAMIEQRLRQQEREGEEGNEEQDVTADMGKNDSERRAASQYKKANVSMRLEAAVQKELAWLADPKALAQRVRRALSKHEARFAATLVRQAHRKKMGSAAAWNHLIEYCFQEDEPAAAWRFYQEMKKRNRHPNVYTYTLMLSGLGKTARPAHRGKGDIDTLKAAMAVYKNTLDPDSPVKPNIIFANAMLTTCIRHGNMETLWAVAAELPQEGPLAPDEKTYTLILRAINYALEQDIAAIPEDQVERVIARKNQAVVEAKRVWSEVVYLWREGRLAPDNYQVNIMGRLLLHGTTDHDLFDVFYLYRQVSGIPILGKEPPKVARPKMRIQEEGKIEVDEDVSDQLVPDADAEFVPFEDTRTKLYRPPPGEDEGVGEVDDEEDFEGLFDPVILEELPEKAGASGGEAAPSRDFVVKEEASVQESSAGEDFAATENTQQESSVEITRTEEIPVTEDSIAESPENSEVLAAESETAGEDASVTENSSENTQTEGTPGTEDFTAQSSMTQASETEAPVAEPKSTGDAQPVEKEAADAAREEQRVISEKWLTPTYLRFTNGALSNVLEASLLMDQGAGLGRAYWQFITMHYRGPKLRPDSENSHQYLRLLRKSHSSRLVTQVLKYQMAPAGQLEGKSFNIALSCCRRDRNNPNVLENTEELLQLMDESAVLSYPRPLHTYLDLIQSFEKDPHRLTTLNRFNLDLGKNKARNLKNVGKDLLGNLWLSALTALRPHVAKFHEALQRQDPLPQHAVRSKKRAAVAVPCFDAWRLMVRIRGMIDLLLGKDHKSLISAEDRKLLKNESEILKPYSDATAVKRFGNKAALILPTREQLKSFERKGRAMGENKSEEKDGDADEA